MYNIPLHIFGPYHAKNTNLSHVTCHSPVTCHIWRKLNIHFSRMSWGDFVPASKMKPKFDYLTPAYFCDIDILDKVTVTLTIFKQNIEKWQKFDTYFQDLLVASLWWYFWKFWEKILFYSTLFCIFIKMIDFTLFLC